MAKYMRENECLPIHNASILLTKFVENKKSSLKDCFLMQKIKLPIEPSKAISHHLYYTVTIMTFELLALATENFDQESLDFGDVKIANLLREVKKTLPEEFKNMNGAEFLKLLRSSVAHNSSTVHNLASDDIKNYDFTLTKKGGITGNYKLTLEDALLVLEAYDKCRIMEKPHAGIDFADCDTVRDILTKRKKCKSFGDFIKFYDYNGNEVSIDKYQDKAFLKFLMKHGSTVNRYKDINHFLTRYFPAKNNKLNQYEHKYQLTMTMCLLLDMGSTLDNMREPTLISFAKKARPEFLQKMTNYNITCEDFIKILERLDPQGIMPYIDKGFLQSILYSSAAFSIFSTHTNNELEELFKKAGHPTDFDTVRHIRNSFIHGKYYYNYDDGFEIYDGTKEVEHITTFDFQTFSDIYWAYAKPTNLETTIKDGVLFVKGNIFEDEPL